MAYINWSQSQERRYNMKKILATLILMVLSIFATVSVVYANPLDTEASIEDSFTWDEAATGGYAYAFTNRVLIDFESVYVEMTTSLMGAFNGSVTTPDWENFIIPNAGPYSSRIEVYDSEISVTPIKSWFMTYEAPGVTELMFSNDGLGGWEIDTSTYTDKYIQIVLMLNTDSKPVDFYYTTTNRMNNFPDSWDFNVDVTYTSSQATIADLPITAGNPYQTGLTGEVFAWEYQELGNQFVATIRYYNDYMLTVPNVGFSDPSFLNKVDTIDYYTVDGEKFLQFNFIDNENVLLTGSGQFAQQWNGFALWNLTTNEFIQYNRALALTYIEVTETREVYAYLYLPNIPIDDILAVAGHYNYRYGYKNVFGTQKYYDWQTAYFALEKDQTTYGSQGVFEGTLPQWSYDAAAYSLAALTVGSILSMVPGLQVIGVPLLFASAALMISAGVDAIDHVLTGKIDEIQTITPSTALRTTLNEHYTKAAGSLTVLPSQAKVHKLFTGLFTQVGTNVVEPNADTLVYTEITWVTAGQVYTLDEKLIDSEAILDQDYQNNLPPEGSNEIGDWWQSTFGENAPYVILGAIVLGIMWIAPTLEKGSRSISNIVSKPRMLLTVGVIIFILLIATGIIAL